MSNVYVSTHTHTPHILECTHSITIFRENQFIDLRIALKTTIKIEFSTKTLGIHAFTKQYVLKSMPRCTRWIILIEWLHWFMGHSVFGVVDVDVFGCFRFHFSIELPFINIWRIHFRNRQKNNNIWTSANGNELTYRTKKKNQSKISKIERKLFLYCRAFFGESGTFDTNLTFHSFKIPNEPKRKRKKKTILLNYDIFVCHFSAP